ncbi:MAG: glycosidase, partial [Rhizobacter sp.]|nr:glycosidase [Rhizobacter sp.]
MGVTTPTWVQCANETFLCTFSGTRSVRFGTGSTWATLQLTEQTECNFTVFGDPAPSHQKVCQVLVDVPVSPAAVKTPKVGVYVGAECVGAAAVGPYATWLGRRPDRVLEFLANFSWANLEEASTKSSKCWVPTGLPITFSIAMLPTDRTSSLTEGAAGLNDEHFRVIARNFVKNGQGNAVIRLGWEFNFPWYPWNAAPDTAAWIQYWRNIVTAMRSVEGQNFKFDWCPAMGQGELDVARAYPGDAYVDYIGMDIYNQTWASPVPSAADIWINYTQQWFGIYWQRDMGLTHGKQLSYPEWGTGTRPDGHGLGDDPAFVQNMITWIATNNVAYHNYWDYQADDYDSKMSNGNFPLSGAL